SGEQGTVDPGQPPKKSPLLDAASVIQWTLYYPVVVDPDELGLGDPEKQALADALKAYREGDLLAAVAAYPENRTPASDAERGFQASLLLAAGRVTEAESAIQGIQGTSVAPRAIQELLA